ncbi:MAG: replication-relaxation family protein [Myxococcales bacterium]|nr:replication-relaxation family protein [Myxococcales bacterium]
MARTKRVTERDRHACAIVREARTLSGEQLLRLVCPGRGGSTQRWVLQSLVEMSLLRRTEWVGRSGVVPVYSVTANGDYEAERVAPGGVSADVVDVASLEHHLALSEVYVRLLEAGITRQVAAAAKAPRRRGRAGALEAVYARAIHPAWRWVVAGDGVSLPWKEYAKGALKERLIRPDAVLELPGAGRRLFVEEETGSHTIRAVSPDKPGATTEKVKRYVAYVTGYVDAQARTTWYQRRYPDGLRPELVLVEPSEARCASVRAAVKQLVRPPLVVHVWTLEAAVAALTVDVGLGVLSSAAAEVPTGRHEVPGGTVLSPAEAEALKRFFVSARSDLKARQADAGQALAALLAAGVAVKGLPEQQQKLLAGVKALQRRLQAPIAPDEYDTMRALVTRLGAVLR